MLVLSRKAGERISIGPEIELTVLDIHKGRVKLGFLGPPEVAIRREELQRRTGPHEARHLGSQPCEVRDAKGV
jgi:carbon storage regulator